VCVGEMRLMAAHSSARRSDPPSHAASRSWWGGVIVWRGLMGGAEVGAEGSKAERGVACAHRWMGIMTARRWQRGYLGEKGAEGFGVRDGIGRFQENKRPLVGFF
jgi:hypothetical protein